MDETEEGLSSEAIAGGAAGGVIVVVGVGGGTVVLLIFVIHKKKKKAKPDGNLKIHVYTCIYIYIHVGMQQIHFSAHVL